MQWRKITLIGVGLLGGSLGLAIKKHNLASKVHGYVRRSSSVDEIIRLGIADEAGTDLRAAVTDADLIILCTPIAQMPELSEMMLSVVKPGCIITDVGSVKGTVVKQFEVLMAKSAAHFVGSHPMAGGEKMGAAAARADLFQKAICVVCPTSATNAGALEQVRAFWTTLGCNVMSLSPELHDEFVSRTSHLPHVLAATLANYVLSPAHAKEQGMLCANGFKDTTRIASGSPEMWKDIALANRKNLARVLGVFIEDLQEFQHALEMEDGAALQEFFATAKERRDRWCAQRAVGSGTQE